MHWDLLGGETPHNGTPCLWGRGAGAGRRDSECWNTWEGRVCTKKPRWSTHISCPFPLWARLFGLCRDASVTSQPSVGCGFPPML